MMSDADTGVLIASSQLRVGEGIRLTLHFSVLLDSGEEVSTTRRGKPAKCVIGDGNLLPGFENALRGMKAGDDAQIRLAAIDAFGEHRKENVQLIEKTRFSAIDLEPGLLVSFAGPAGELPGTVLKVLDNHVQVDFNHPLAGRSIVFDVSILKLEALQT